MSEAVTLPPTSPVKLNALQRLMVWSGGAASEYVAWCPAGERRYHVSIGIAVVLTALMAMISGSYAALTIVKDEQVAFAVGVCWSVFVFFLDRFFVGTMSKGSGAFMLGLRLVLSLCIASIVARPLELRVFRDEIIDSLRSDRRQNLLAEERARVKEEEHIKAMIASAGSGADLSQISRADGSQGEFSDPAVTQLEIDVAKFTAEANKCRQEYERKVTHADWECNGAEVRDSLGNLITSGIKKEGPRCIAKRNEAARYLKAECDPTTKRLEDAKDALSTRDETLRSSFATRLDGIEKLQDSDFSLLSRHNALWKLQKQRSVLYLSLLLTSIFILLEISPVLLKVYLIREGRLRCYERYVDVESRRFEHLAKANERRWEVEEAVRQAYVSQWTASINEGGDTTKDESKKKSFENLVEYVLQGFVQKPYRVIGTAMETGEQGLASEAKPVVQRTTGGDIKSQPNRVVFGLAGSVLLVCVAVATRYYSREDLTVDAVLGTATALLVLYVTMHKASDASRGGLSNAE